MWPQHVPWFQLVTFNSFYTHDFVPWINVTGHFQPCDLSATHDNKCWYAVFGRLEPRRAACVKHKLRYVSIAGVAGGGKCEALWPALAFSAAKMDPDTWHCLIHVSRETDLPLVDFTPQNILVSSVLPACFSAIGVSGIMWHTRAGTRAASFACHWINESLCVSTLCPCSSEWAVHVFVLRIYRKVNSCLCWNEVRCPGKTNTQELKSRNARSCRFCITEAPLQ